MKKLKQESEKEGENTSDVNDLLGKIMVEQTKLEDERFFKTGEDEDFTLPPPPKKKSYFEWWQVGILVGAFLLIITIHQVLSQPETNFRGF